MASQSIGLIQLAVLVTLVGANTSTDAYFYLFNMGMLPIQIGIVGVMYPLLLNSDRISSRAARQIRFFVPVASACLVGGGAAWLAVNGRVDEGFLPLLSVAMANSFVQARIWFRAVLSEANGEPIWMSGVAIPANTLATLALIIPFSSDPTVRVTVMVSALLIANIGLLMWMSSRRIGMSMMDVLPDHGAKGLRGGWWFLVKSGVGYGGVAVLQSLSVLLPPAALTFLSVITKVVGSLVATFVNAVMPRLLNHRSVSLRPSMVFLAVLGAGVLVAGIAATAVSIALLPELALAVAAGSLWAVASVTNAVSQRSAYRFLPANASRITIVAVPLAVLLAIASSFTPQFQLATLLCAFALIEAAAGTLLLWTLKQRIIALCGLGIIFATAGAWIATLAPL